MFVCFLRWIFVFFFLSCVEKSNDNRCVRLLYRSLDYWLKFGLVFCYLVIMAEKNVC